MAGRQDRFRRPYVGRVRRASFVTLVLVASVIPTVASTDLGARPAGAAPSSACPTGATLDVFAHQDDTLLLGSPDLLHDVTGGRCVRTVFLTAGDDGMDQTYWSSRESGVEVAYAQMAGVPDVWTSSDAGVAGHPMPLLTLSGNPRISVVFMRLPDGMVPGTGSALYGYQSLQRLYTDVIPTVTADDNSSSYTKQDLTAALTALMDSYAPDRINTQDYAGVFGDGDHSDHHAAAFFTRDAASGVFDPPLPDRLSRLHGGRSPSERVRD